MLLGGRWNSRGKRVIYAASTYAGALLEQLAHSNIGLLPGKQVWIEITIPDDLAVDQVGVDEIPGWNAADMIASRECGDRWIDRQTSAILVVPSAVTDGMENNILINPAHPEFAGITASEPTPVRWDPRLK